MGQLARGTVKLYRHFPSCAWIFLFSTLTLKFRSPQELTENLAWNWGILHRVLTKAYTHNLSTLLTLWVCVKTDKSSLSLLNCFYYIHMLVSSGTASCLSNQQLASSLPLLSSWERGGQKSSILVPSAQGIACLSWQFSKLISHCQFLMPRTLTLLPHILISTLGSSVFTPPYQDEKSFTSPELPISRRIQVLKQGPLLRGKKDNEWETKWKTTKPKPHRWRQTLRSPRNKSCSLKDRGSSLRLASIPHPCGR